MHDMTTRPDEQPQPMDIKLRDWAWPLATLLVQLLLSLALGYCTVSGSFWTTPVLGLLIFSSAFPLWVLVLAMTHTGRGRWVIRGVVVGILLLASIWHLASFLRYRDQGHRLSAVDLWAGWQEPQIRAFMFETILSLKAVLFLAVLGLLFVGCWLVCRQISRMTACWLSLTLVVLGTIGSLPANLPIRIPDILFAFFHGTARPAMAPWARVHDGTMLFPQSTTEEETANPNDSLAKSLARSANGVEWRAPGVPELADLRGRYAERDVVVVILESHRLSDIAPYGSEAFSHMDLCPQITAFAKDSWWFSNYVQSGHGTVWALYSILTGVTPPMTLSNHEGAGADAGNRLTAYGCLPAFRALGYECDMLVGCEYTFWDLASMLRHAKTSGPWTEAEQSLLASHVRSVWGVGDDAIYQLARRRMEVSRKLGQRRLQILKTSSNHEPYFFRPELPRNHIGGMQYADEEFGKFIAWIDQLPAEERPLVFVTGDHGHVERLERNNPLQRYGLEALRVPAFLRFPDGIKAKARLDELISHQDLLALLLLLVDPAPKEAPEKFIDRHRHALAFVQASGYGLMTKQLYRPFWASPQDGKVFEIEGYWQVRETQDAEKIRAMNDLHKRCLEEHDVLWNLNLNTNPSQEP